MLKSPGRGRRPNVTGTTGERKQISKLLPGFPLFKKHYKRAASLVSSYKTTFLGQNQGALQSPCNLTTSERIVAAVGICLNSYSWYNFWFKLCTWYNLGTPPETRGSSQTVNCGSFNPHTGDKKNTDWASFFRDF